jgi:hypothetical protein
MTTIGIPWLKDPVQALQVAANQGKPALLDFSAAPQ